VRLSYNPSLSDSWRLEITWPSSAPVRHGDRVVVDSGLLGSHQQDYLARYSTVHKRTRHRISKHAAGMPGDVIKVHGDVLEVHGKKVRVLRTIGERPTDSYYGQDGTYVIPEGHVFLLNPGILSIDSRYLGPVPVSAIVGRWKPLPWGQKDIGVPDEILQALSQKSSPKS
jgi:type IV secretory pathway protease TraF